MEENKSVAVKMLNLVETYFESYNNEINKYLTRGISLPQTA